MERESTDIMRKFDICSGFTILILVVFLLAGCGGKQAESETSSLELEDSVTTVSDTNPADEKRAEFDGGRDGDFHIFRR